MCASQHGYHRKNTGKLYHPTRVTMRSDLHIHFRRFDMPSLAPQWLIRCELFWRRWVFASHKENLTPVFTLEWKITISSFLKAFRLPSDFKPFPLSCLPSTRSPVNSDGHYPRTFSFGLSELWAALSTFNYCLLFKLFLQFVFCCTSLVSVCLLNLFAPFEPFFFFLWIPLQAFMHWNLCRPLLFLFSWDETWVRQLSLCWWLPRLFPFHIFPCWATEPEMHSALESRPLDSTVVSFKADIIYLFCFV